MNHNTLLVFHAIFFWYADSLSANLYLQFSYSLAWAFFLPFVHLIFICTQNKKTVILASNEEHLAFLLHLTKCSKDHNHFWLQQHSWVLANSLPHLQMKTPNLHHKALCNHHRTKENAKLDQKYETCGTRLFKSTVAFLLQFMILFLHKHHAKKTYMSKYILLSQIRTCKIEYSVMII